MNAYLVPAGFVCGSCGFPLLHVDKKPYDVAKSKGVIQLICPHRECADYDKPMEMDIPCVELRPTSSAEILEELRVVENRKAIQLVSR